MALLGTVAAGLGINQALDFLSNSILDPVATGLGNLISGGTWQQDGATIKSQEFAAKEAQKTRDENRYLNENQYSMAINDLEKNGLNPNMIYGSGGTPSISGTSSTASAGSGRSARMNHNSNVIAQVSNLMDSITNARALDRTTAKKSDDRATQRIYDKVDDIMSVLVNRSKYSG